jgi:hypothetical protein
MEAPMNRKHAFAISLLLGLAIVAGAFAATRGGGSGDAAARATVTPIADNALAAENARLDRYEATLDRLLVKARHQRAHASAAAPAVVVATPAPAQSWSDDDHFGESEHGDDDSGHGSGGGGYEADD